MNEKQRNVVLVGLLLVALCAFFPPRRYSGNTVTVNNSTVAPRAFLWHQRLHILGSAGSGFGSGVEIDTAKLLAEVIGFGALTGVAFIYFRR